jgi:hypothetical protein
MDDDHRTIREQIADTDATKLTLIDDVINDHMSGDFDADDAIERIARIVHDERKAGA